MGCSIGGGKPVNDFTNRATIYGWINVDKISGNHLFSMSMRQYAPRSEEPFYGMGIKKFQGGYLIWQHAAKPGTRIEFSSMSLQSCAAIICSNTINEYDFGPFGSAPGKVDVPRPGVFYIGNWALVRTKRGFFRPGEFDTRRVRSGPSQAQLLAELMKTLPEGHPIVGQRIQAAAR